MSSVRPQPLAEGRFQLIEVIGEGGMATVYRAFDQRLQRPRAIKILSPAFAQRPALRRRFLSDAQTMANLETARVVRVFDMGEDGERVFIVMELIEGGSLVDRVRAHGALPPRMATRVTIELCEAIHAAHEANVIHRDIKPHNVLLTKNGELRITDFGIAQVQADDKAGMTRTGAVLGTWGFMAPEQKSNAKQVDARADIYSIGGTLWSLLKNDTPPELFMSDGEAEWYEGVPEPLAEVIRRSTRYRREDRYPSARAMADALRAILPLLPEDPPDTPDLVSRVPERQSNAEVIDTLAQLDPDAYRRAQPNEGTMVPEAPRAATLAEPPPPPVAIDRPSPRTNRPRGPQSPTPRAPPSTSARVLLPAAVVMALGVAGLLLWFVRPPPVVTPTGGTTAPVATDPASPGATPPADPAANPAGAPTPGGNPGENPGTPAGNSSPSGPITPRGPGTPTATNGGGTLPNGGGTATPTPDGATSTPTATPGTAPPPPSAPTPVGDVAATPGEKPTPPEARPPAAPAGKLTTSSSGAATVGGTATITASIGGKYTLKLYYRGVGGGAFHDKAMNAAGPGSYTASVKVDDSMAGGIEYFVAATDVSGTTVRDGSAAKPMKIAVAP